METERKNCKLITVEQANRLATAKTFLKKEAKGNRFGDFNQKPR